MSWANKFSKPYRIESGKGFRLKDFNPDDTAHLHSKEHAEELLEQSIREMMRDLTPMIAVGLALTKC